MSQRLATIFVSGVTDGTPTQSSAPVTGVSYDDLSQALAGAFYGVDDKLTQFYAVANDGRLITEVFLLEDGGATVFALDLFISQLSMFLEAEEPCPM